MIYKYEPLNLGPPNYTIGPPWGAPPAPQNGPQSFKASKLIKSFQYFAKYIKI